MERLEIRVGAELLGDLRVLSDLIPVSAYVRQLLQDHVDSNRELLSSREGRVQLESRGVAEGDVLQFAGPGELDVKVEGVVEGVVNPLRRAARLAGDLGDFEDFME